MHGSTHFARRSQARAKYFVLEDTLLGQFLKKLCCKNLHLVKLLKIHPHTKFYNIKKKKKEREEISTPTSLCFLLLLFAATGLLV